MKPKISVIIPAYNVEKHIDRCLNSIVDQTYGTDNLEIIVVDDASTDETVRHIEAFEHRFPQSILLIKCAENGRQGTARNIGLDYASGEYISFVDADDMLNITMLEKLMNIALKYDCDEVECGYSMFYSESDACVYNDIKQSYYLDLDNIDNRKSFIINSLKTAVWGRLYKRSIIEENRLRFVGHLFYQDVQFSGLAMFMIHSYYRLNETLYHYFVNEEGTIHSPYNAKKVRQEITVMDKYLEELYARDMLNDIISNYGKEFEFYCVNKCYIDPFVLINRGNQELKNTLSEIDHFRAHILDLFPDAAKNELINEYFSNMSGLYRLAVLMLSDYKTVTETLIDQEHDKTIVLVYGHHNKSYLEKNKEFLKTHFSEYSITEIYNEFYAIEYPLLKHVLKQDDIIAFSVYDYSDSADQKKTENILRSAVNYHTQNKIIIFLYNLYFCDNEECLSELAHSISCYKDHHDISVIFATDKAHKIAQTAFPDNIKIFLSKYEAT